MTIEVHDQNLGVEEGLFSDLATIPVSPTNHATPAIGARFYARDTGQSFELRPGLTLADDRIWVEIGPRTNGDLTVTGTLSVLGDLRLSHTDTTSTPTDPVTANTISGRSAFTGLGTDTVTVNNSLVHTSSEVFIQLRSGAIAEGITGVEVSTAEGSFTVKAPSGLGTPVQFSWLVVNPVAP